jgi:alpha 1,6-mannosyltransferase
MDALLTKARGVDGLAAVQLPRNTWRLTRTLLVVVLVLLVVFMSRKPISSQYSHYGRYHYDLSSEASSVSNSNSSDGPFDPTRLGPLPKKIWQVWKNMDDSTAKDIKNKWTAMNNGYAHTLLDDPMAVEYARRTGFGEQLSEALETLNNTGSRSDLIRYMVLGAEGGVYSDSDTDPVVPVAQWVPDRFKQRAKLLVGIEFDELDKDPKERDGNMLHTLQFCQWTVAASAGHIVFSNMIQHALGRIEGYRVEKGLGSIAQLRLENMEVLNSTGPAAWTQIVFEYMRSVEPTLKSLKDFSGLQQPRLIGDVLLLPIDGFATNVGHSGSGKHPEQALIHHGFHGSWKTG